MKESRRAAGRQLVWLCCAVYFISYLARLNFSAAMAEMIRVEVLTKTGAGLVGTALFVAYGAGQLVSGCLGDRMKPEILILAGLALTAASNVCMPFLRALPFFLVVWGINGFAQALLWPPMVKLLSVALSGERYAKACVWVTAASQFATVAIYLAVPACISLWDWRSVFWLSAALAAGICVVWTVGCRRLKSSAPEELASPTERPAPDSSPVRFQTLILSSGLALVLAAIALQGFLRDGITSWMPTYLSEVFSLPTAVSIFLNVLLPLFGVFTLYLAGALYRRVFRNELTEAAFFFGIGLVCCLVLSLFGSRSAAVSLVFAALATGSMHAVNLMLISFVPRRFAAYGKAATASGVTNAFTYVGSAASSYGFAAIAGGFGWGVLIWIWVGVCALGLVSLALVFRKWNRFCSIKLS